MAEFLDLIESVRAEEASTSRLFGNEGTSIRSVNKGSPRYKTALSEMAALVADVYTGKRPTYRLQEAMSTSDFPLLFGDILDRQLLANFAELPQTYRNYLRISTVPDFRTVSRFAIDGGLTDLEAVPELTEYPAGSVSEARDQFSVKKFGKRMPFSWEAILNDDLDALKDIPRRMASSARNSVERFATGLFAASTGPNATLYSSGHHNIVTSNPALSIAGLQTAMQILAAQTDTDGNPIMTDAVWLVVPPSLEITAMNILNATEIRAAEVGGTSNQILVAKNWMGGRVKLAVNPFLPLIDTTHGTTAWYLFSDPNSGRPAIDVAFLRGHEQPELFMKTGNQVRVGGGTADPMDGSYENDSIEYKVRYVFGGALLTNTGGWRGTVASEGDGS